MWGENEVFYYIKLREFENMYLNEVQERYKDCIPPVLAYFASFWSVCGGALKREGKIGWTDKQKELLIDWLNHVNVKLEAVKLIYKI